jgi:hypothetical protein
VGPRAGLDVCEKSRPHRDFFLFFLPYLFVSCSLCSIVRSRPIVLRAVNFSIMKNPTASVGSEPAILGSIRSPDRPARSSVAIPTELPGPLFNHII